MLKQRVERALSSSAVGRIMGHRISGKRLILAYHGITPEGDPLAGERALFVNQRDFAAHLDILSEIADVSPLDRIDDASNGRPRVAITFDDAYRGAVKEGVRELAKRGLPATIFVAPGRLNGHVFWWDALSHGSAAMDEGIKHHALNKLRGSDECVRAWAARIRLQSTDSLPPHAQTATRDELHSALDIWGITVGSHTWSHANLASLGTSDITAEIEHARDWLRTEFGEKAIPWLAYPYGMDSPEVHRVAANASYSGGLRIGGGWHSLSEVSPFARPRLNIGGGLSVAGFRARIVGAVRP
ncbi:MAG: putative xylanase/chitin deacetylase [Bryobacterales bacterium]|nr:putative xylanase/chitin deacetylase [Bryobacterales bacterium]